MALVACSTCDQRVFNLVLPLVVPLMIRRLQTSFGIRTSAELHVGNRFPLRQVYSLSHIHVVHITEFFLDFFRKYCEEKSETFTEF